MSAAPVDVLAVMDMARLYVEEAHEIHPGDFKPGVGRRNVAQIVEARAAVAELIEAADEASVALGKSMANTDELCAHIRLCAALSRVGGTA